MLESWSVVCNLNPPVLVVSPQPEVVWAVVVIDVEWEGVCQQCQRCQRWAPDKAVIMILVLSWSPGGGAKYKTALSIVLSHIGPLWSRQLRLLNLKHLLHISVLNTLAVATQSDGTYSSATVHNIKWSDDHSPGTSISRSNLFLFCSFLSPKIYIFCNHFPRKAHGVLPVRQQEAEIN